MAITLTAASAKSAPPGEKRYAIGSAKVVGLVLEITPNGARSFYWRGRIRGGGMVVMRLGSFGSEMTVAEAEARAADCLRQARAGVDPRAERARTLAVQKEKDAVAMATFGEAAKGYLDAFEKGQAVCNKRGGAPKESSVRREKLSVAKAIAIVGKDTPLASLDRKAALRVRDGNPDLSPGSRKHVWTAAQRVMAEALHRGLYEGANLFRDVKAPHGSEARTRYLSPEEIAKVWRAAGELDQPWTDLIRFLIAVPLRFGNAAGLRWRDVRGDLLHLADTKNGLAWPAPLTTQGAEILARRRPGADDPDGLVFPSGGDPNGRGAGNLIKGAFKVKDRLDRLSGVEGWRVHDLRRTVASTLSDRRDDADPGAVDLWLQHKPGGIRATYNTSRSVPATRRVAAMWGEELGKILVEFKAAEPQPAAGVTRIGDVR